MQITDFSQLTPAAESTANEAELGRNDFLKMLIAQLENQDPLNPQEATEFTAQLAQFTSLEKLISIDGSMSSVSESQNLLGATLEGLASASLIGREALVVSDSFEIGAGGTPVSRPAYSLPEPSSSTTLRVLDASGLLVREASLGPQTAGFHAVPDELLAELDPDVYRFEVDARVNDEALAATSLVNGIVEAAIPLGLEPQIAIGRMILPYAAVQEIRDAGPSL